MQSQSWSWLLHTAFRACLRPLPFRPSGLCEAVRRSLQRRSGQYSSPRPTSIGSCPVHNTHIPIATSPRSRVVICQTCCPPLCRPMLLGPSGSLARGDKVLTKSQEAASITLAGPLQSTERPRIACTGAGSRTSSSAGGSLTSSRSASRCLRRPPPARRCPRNRPGAAEAACASGLD